MVQLCLKAVVQLTNSVVNVRDATQVAKTEATNEAIVED